MIDYDYDLSDEGELDYEVIGGTIYYMARPKLRHSIISDNLTKIFNNFLEEKDCFYFSDGTELLIEQILKSQNKLDYLKNLKRGKNKDKEEKLMPDGMIVCDITDDIILDKNSIDKTPKLVVEILSNLSKKSRQRNEVEKLNIYKEIGVEEYLIVNPVTFSIKQYSKTGDNNYIENYYAIDYENHDVIKFNNMLGFEVKLQNVFHKIFNIYTVDTDENEKER